jgi:5-methyltetrahydropteroyltriglutamate--homocysteine methyltransferase
MIIMRLLAANTGSYPKIGDSPEKQKHREAYARWEKGELTDEEFENIQREVIKEVIEEQVKAGLDMVTDGQIRWIDPISHFTKNLKNCELDGLLRYFDTNFYFRQPVVRDKPVIIEPVARAEYLFAKRISPVPLKQVITGPYTLARLSINKAGVDFHTMVRWFAEVVAQEVHALSRLGRCFIQIDEPAILKHPEDLSIFEEAIHEVCTEKRRSKIYLYTYFGDASPFLEAFEKLPVNGVGFDFTYSPKLPDLIKKHGFEKEAIGLGMIDGRNTRLENPRELLPVLRKVLSGVEADILYLNPSCGLEFLPREVAFQKLKRTVEIRDFIRKKLL